MTARAPGDDAGVKAEQHLQAMNVKMNAVERGKTCGNATPPPPIDGVSRRADLADAKASAHFGVDVY